MAWCPFAKKLELQPESDSQAAIDPTQFIMHSIAAPWDEERIYEYWRDSTNLESHFGLDYDGSLGQFIGTQTRADANYRANLRPDGTGAVSIETASNLKHTDPWTPEQVETLIRLGVWLHEEHGIPLRICRTASDPGYGYHRLFADWSTGGTECPGDARVAQFKTVVFPGIVARATGTNPPQEEPVALTDAEIKAIGRQVVTGANGAKSPDDPTVEWAVSSFLGLTLKAVRAVAADVAAVEAKVDAISVGGVDLDALAVKVADLLAARLAK